MLAQEVKARTKYDKSFKEVLEKIRKDKSVFTQYVRETIENTHPQFIKHLNEHNLTDSEINYMCLYSIGIRGSDLGSYLGMSNHYNISFSIRKKLDIEDKKVYLNTYILTLMQDL